jgi:hypothetical protein
MMASFSNQLCSPKGVKAFDWRATKDLPNSTCQSNRNNRSIYLETETKNLFPSMITSQFSSSFKATLIDRKISTLEKVIRLCEDVLPTGCIVIGNPEQSLRNILSDLSCLARMIRTYSISNEGIIYKIEIQQTTIKQLIDTLCSSVNELKYNAILEDLKSQAEYAQENLKVDLSFNEPLKHLICVNTTLIHIHMTNLETIDYLNNELISWTSQPVSEIFSLTESTEMSIFTDSLDD